MRPAPLEVYLLGRRKDGNASDAIMVDAGSCGRCRIGGPTAKGRRSICEAKSTEQWGGGELSGRFVGRWDGASAGRDQAGENEFEIAFHGRTSAGGEGGVAGPVRVGRTFDGSRSRSDTGAGVWSI